MQIIIEGNLDPSGSYAIVNLEMAKGLLNLGCEVSLYPLDISLSEARGIISSRSISAHVVDGTATCDVRIRQIWPPIWEKAHNKEKLVVIQPWEFGSIPIDWLDGTKNVDQIWVPSNYVKGCYVQSGVIESKVVVIPNGVDAEALALGAKKVSSTRSYADDKPFELLFLGGAIFRKGIDLLIDAMALLPPYDRERIHLTIKKVGSEGAYKGQSLGRC